MDNPLSWQYLTTVPGPNEVFGPFALGYVVLFGIGFVVSVFLYNDVVRRYANHSVKRRTIRRGAGIAMTVFGVGLFFFGIRVLQINPFGFGMRLWLWLTFLAAVAMFLYFAYYLRTAYRAALRAYEERRIKRQALQPVVAAAGASSRHLASEIQRYEARRPVKRRKR